MWFKRIRLSRGWMGAGFTVCLALLMALPAAATTQNWTFDSSAAYAVSNASDVEFVGGTIRLKEPVPVWWSSVGHFLYRRQLRVSAGAVDVPAGTPVKYALDHHALVDAGLALASGDDVRIAYWDGSTWTEVPRVNEGAWNDPGTLAQLWFKTQAKITAGNYSTGYYLYYGDPNLGAPGNATRANVFSMGTRTWDSDADWNSGTHVGGKTVSSGGDLQETVFTTSSVPTSTGAQAYAYPTALTGNVKPPAPSSTSWVSASSADKTAASTQDGTFFVTRTATGHDQYEWQLYKFVVGAGIKPISLTLNWKGYGDPAQGYPTYVYLWNQGGDWDVQHTEVIGANKLITISKPAAEAASYVNQSTGEVWVGVGTRHSNSAPSVTLTSQGGMSWTPAYRNLYDYNSFQWPLTWTSTDPEGDAIVSTVVSVRSSSGWTTTSGDLGSATSWNLTVPSTNAWTQYWWKVKVTDAKGASYETPTEWSFISFYSEPTPTSCPFLFTWDGKQYKYFGDLAGQTLGPDTGGWAGNMRPSAVALPGFKPDENNLYRIKVREPLTEINFFDQARLLLVDHPAGYQVISSWAPNLYRMNPVPPLTFWTLHNPRLPVKAYDSQGNDILPLISKVDNLTPKPPTKGSIDLILDFGKIEHPEYAKLVVDGWKYIDEYSRADTEPFSIAVMGKDGNWKKLKGSPQIRGDLATVVWDLANAFETDDQRIKLAGVTSRRVTHYFDRIRLDDSAPVPVTVTEVTPSSAVLSHMGYLTLDSINHDHRMDALDDTLPDRPDSLWFGDYTKYGEVSPLLRESDDRFVIMRHGDGVEITFPAPASGPAPGMERTPVFLADVWYKTRSRVVGQYPYKGMKSYPYKEENPNLKDPAYQEYIKTWNTRHYDVPEGLTWVEGAYPDPKDRPEGFGYGPPRPLTPAPSTGSAPAAPAPETAAAPESPAPVHYSVNTDYVNLVTTNYSTQAQYLSPVVSLSPLQVVAVKVDWAEPASQPAGTSLTVEVSPNNGTNWYPATNGGTVTFGAESAPANVNLQFRVTFNTPDTSKTAKLQWLTLTYYTRQPLISEPSVARESDPDQGAYPTNRPSVRPLQGVLYTTLSGFRQTVSEDTTGSVGYQISRDGTNWYYWNGAWSAAANNTQVSSAADINANLSSFSPSGVGDGTFYFKAFLISDGSQPVKLDNVALDYTLVDNVTITPSNASPGTAVQGAVRVAAAKFTVSANHNTATWSSFSPVLLGTPGDIQVGGVKVWRDNGDGVLTAADEIIGSGTFDSLGRVAISLTVPQVITTTPNTYFVSLDLSLNAGVGDTERIYLEANSFGLVPDLFHPDVIAADNLPFTSSAVTVSDAPDTVLVAFDGSTNVPSDVTEGDAGIQMGALTLTTQGDKATFNRLTVNLVGTASSSHLTSVRLYRSAGGSGRFNAGVDQLLASGVFSGGTATLNLSTPEQLTTTSRQYILVVNTAADSGSHDFALQIPAGGIGVAAPDVVDPGAGFPLTSSTVNIAATTRTMTVAVANVVAAGTTATQGATDLPFLRIHVSGSGTLDWNSLRVNRIVPPYFSQVKVWRDLRPGSQTTFDPAQLAMPAIGSAAGANNAAITFTSPEVVTTSTQTYWVTGDLAPTGNAGGNAKLSIDYASDFGVDAGTAVSGTVAASEAVLISDVGDQVAWAYSPKASAARQGDSDVTLAALRLSTTDTANLTGLTLRLGGTATALDVSGFRLFADVDGDGQLGAGDGPALATGVADFAAHQVTFDLATAKPGISATPSDYLVVADVALGAGVGRTLVLQGDASSLTLLGSDDTVAPTGTDLDTTLTIEKKPEAVTVSKQPVTPVALQGSSDVPVARFLLSTSENDATFTGLTVTLTGTGQPGEVTEVSLWRAADDGSFTSNLDHRLALGAFAGQTATLAVGGGLPVGTTPTALYVTYSFDPLATLGATFGASLAASTDVSVAAPDTVDAGGFPLTWTPVALGRSAKTVTITGPERSIAPPVVVPSMGNIPVLAFQAAVPSDDTVLQAVTVSLASSAGWSRITRVKVWRDGGAGDGVWQPTVDTVVGQAAPTGNQVTVALGDLQPIISGHPVWFFVTYDLSSAAKADETLGGTLDGPGAFTFSRGDTAAAGVITSGTITVQPVSAGIPALDGMSFAISQSNDRDAAVPGVQTQLYGTGSDPVTIRIANNGTTTAYDVNPAGGNWSLLVTWLPGVNEVTVTAGAQTVAFTVNLIDPFGIVYNAASGAPVSGATVTLEQRNGQTYDQVGTQTTGADGSYSFLVPAGDYRLSVTAPGFGAVPTGSRLVSVPEGNGLGTTPGSVDGTYRDIYYGGPFTVTVAPLHFDIPLDPTEFQLLGLVKTVDRAVATVGDVLTFRVRLTNTQPTALAAPVILDTLPAALGYVRGSTIIQGQAGADPAVEGRTLSFALPAIPAGGEAWLTYRVVVKPSATPGDYVNSAVATREDSQVRLSAVATATVKVVSDPFFQLSNVLGLVWGDLNGNGQLDEGEAGLGNARVIADDGTIITADAAGRFHLAGLPGLSKAFRLDLASLPAGATSTTPNPVVVTLRPGLPAEVEFGVKLAEGAPDGAPRQGGNLQLITGDLLLGGGVQAGRLAGYVERSIGDKYHLVASYDSGRARESQAQANTEQGYLGYGDQSKLDGSAAHSSTPLYLSLTGPGLEAKWGDLQLPATQGAGREATGASLTLKEGETAGAAAARSLNLYAATLVFPKVRDELRAQDGSLYHLSHRPVIADTLKAWLEARDQFTGQVVARIDLSAGRDFDFDPVSGRIVTREPIPSTVVGGSLLGRPAEADRPVYLVVDYQYDSTALSPSVFGARGEAQLGGENRFGFTLATADEGRASLWSADLAGKAGPFAKYRLEAGAGRVTDVARYTSDDGGVNYQAEPAAGGTGAKLALSALIDLGKVAAAAGTKTETGREADRARTVSRPDALATGAADSPFRKQVVQDLKGYFRPEDFVVGLKSGSGDSEPALLKNSALAKDLVPEDKPLFSPGWWKKDGAVTVETKVTETTAGYGSGTEPVTTDQQQVAYKMKAQTSPGVTVQVGSEATYTTTAANEKVTGSVKLENGKAALSAELGETRSTTGGQPQQVDRTLGAEYRYAVNERLAVTVGRKIDYEQPDLTVNSLGAVAKAGKVTAEGKYNSGEKEKSGMVSLAYSLQPGARLYTNWEGGERDGEDLHRFTIGGSTDVNDRTRIFLERKLDAASDGLSSTDAAGAEFRPQDGLGLSVALGRGLAPNGSERTSGSLGLNYRQESGALLSSGLEVSKQADGRRDIALRGRGELPLGRDLSLLGRVSLSELSGAGYTGGNLGEFAVGAAYRPVDPRRINLLAQVVYRTEDGDPTGTGGDASAVDSLVFSTEGTYRLGARWRLGEKVAWKRAASEADYTDTVLWASRVLYEVEPGVELAGEYRLVKQGAETDSGPVVEADVALPYMENVTLGVGYNFAGFSDSLLSDTPENGWFLRLRGLF